jgi:DNA replication and repair protein RecF
MYLSKLHLRNFRLYDNELFEFNPGLNVIRGPNAQGKTTILEALYLLMNGRSFRTTQLHDMIRHGASFFHIEALFFKHGIEQRLKVAFDGKERRVTYNNTSFSTFTSLFGLLQGVLMAPDDVSLVKAGPAIRRNFLDLQIEQVDPLYIHHSSRFNRAMRQRNHLLKAKSVAAIESWEQEMAIASAYLTQQRHQTAYNLRLRGEKLYHLLSAEESLLSLVYKTQMAQQSEIEVARQYYVEQFKRHRAREMHLGCTLYGPHKDDLLITIGEKEVRFFASEGQQRTSVVALRMAEWERLQELTKLNPLMLIDDVGVSLDENRREKLMKHIEHFGQVFLTTTAKEGI